MISEKKIGVTVITGFFGAGKTTLLNWILNKCDTKKIAVAENEFGSIPVDTELIKGVDASKIFELKQGCICCTIYDEYELVLQELAIQYPGIEHLIIETTGISDPVSVINPFIGNQKLSDYYKFNRMISVMDGANFDSQTITEIAEKQIAFSDSVFISKTDLISTDKTEFLVKTVQQLNPYCTVFWNLNEETDLLKPINQIRYFPTKTISIKTKNKITSDTLSFNFKPDKEDFLSKLEYFAEINKTKIFRIKGILNFRNEVYEFVLQGVGGSISIEESDKIQNNRDSFLVLIGFLDGSEKEEILSFIN